MSSHIGAGEYSKYHAKKTEIDGITFDSRKEARRYNELKLLERAGEIKEIQLQPVFELQPAFKKDGKTYRAITYKADFAYREKNGNAIIEDTKGFQTEIFKLKRKLFEYNYSHLTLKLL